MNIKRGVFGLVCVVIGVVILTVSVVKASLDIDAKERDNNNLSSTPISFSVIKDDGAIESYSYNIPEVSMLPSNPLYGFKRVRDYLWTMLASGPINKSKITLLIADKKISEAKSLAAGSQLRYALESATEALNQLKYAHKLVSSVQIETDELRQLDTRIYEAGLAYKEIIKPIGETFDVDITKFNQLVNDIDKWNEERRQEKEAKSY